MGLFERRLTIDSGRSPDLRCRSRPCSIQSTCSRASSRSRDGRRREPLRQIANRDGSPRLARQLRSASARRGRYWLPPRDRDRRAHGKIMLRRHHVGHLRRVGRQTARGPRRRSSRTKTGPDLLLIRRDRHRIGVLDQHRRDRRAALPRRRVAVGSPDPALIEPAHSNRSRLSTGDLSIGIPRNCCGGRRPRGARTRDDGDAARACIATVRSAGAKP